MSKSSKATHDKENVGKNQETGGADIVNGRAYRGTVVISILSHRVTAFTIFLPLDGTVFIHVLAPCARDNGIPLPLFSSRDGTSIGRNLVVFAYSVESSIAPL